MATNAYMEMIEARRDTIAELTQKGWTANQIAEFLDVTTRTVQRARKRREVAQPYHPPHPPEMWTRVEEMIEDGCSVAEAARTVGVCEYLAYRRFKGRSRYTRKDGSMLRDLVKAVDKIPVWQPYPAVKVSK